MKDREQREKGAISIDVHGQTYTLVFDINAMASLEDSLSTPDREVTFDQVIQKCLAGSVRYVRALVWAALHRHHPKMSLDDVGNWLVDAGGIQVVTQKVMEAAGLGAPDPEDLQELGTSQKRPRKARVNAKRGGTGDSSVSAPVRPA